MISCYLQILITFDLLLTSIFMSVAQPAGLNELTIRP